MHRNSRARARFHKRCASAVLCVALPVAELFGQTVAGISHAPIPPVHAMPSRLVSVGPQGITLSTSFDADEPPANAARFWFTPRAIDIRVVPPLPALVPETGTELIGKPVALSDLFVLASAIEQHYWTVEQRRVRASLPAQEIRLGRVEMVVRDAPMPEPAIDLAQMPATERLDREREPVEGVQIAAAVDASAIETPQSATPTRTVSLLDAYRSARTFDSQLASAVAARDAAREKGPQGRALMLPSLSGAANYAYNDADNRSLDREFGFINRGYTFTLNQPLYRPGNVIQYAQSELAVLQAEALYAQAVQELLLRATQAYLDVLAAADTLDFIRAQKRAIAEQLAQAKHNFEIGTATITDADEAQARFDLAQAQEIGAQSELELKRRALAQISGLQDVQLAPLREAVQVPRAEPDELARWVELAKRGAQTVRAQELAFDIARREVERARTGHYPTLDLVASHGHSVGGNAAQTGARTDLQVNTVGVQLAIPLYAGGAISSRLREAVANQERARADLESARRAAELAVYQAYLGLNNGIAQVSALSQALVSSQTALESNRLGYQVGVRINIDVLNAQQQVFQTKRDLQKARYEAILNGLRLKAAVGALGEQDLVLLDELITSR